MENTILRIIEKGYARGNEVFKRAKVVVNVFDQTGIGDGS
jgi:molecular chaperone GrpE (heat shock protein)